jgi:hypothetical protein
MANDKQAKLVGVLIQKKAESSPFRTIQRGGRRAERFDEELGAYVSEVVEEVPDLVLFTIVQRSREDKDAEPVFLNCAAEYRPVDLERGDLVEITATRTVRRWTGKDGIERQGVQWNVASHRLLFAASAFKSSDRKDAGRPTERSYDGPGPFEPTSPKMTASEEDKERREIARRAAEKKAAEVWVRTCRAEVVTARGARLDAEKTGAPAEELAALKAAEMDAHRAAQAAAAAFERLA